MPCRPPCRSEPAVHCALVLALSATLAHAQADTARPATTSRTLLPINFEHSAEFRWMNKPVQARRMLDDMTQPAAWTMTGAGTLTWPQPKSAADRRALRVDMQLTRQAPATGRLRLPAVNLQRRVPDEDWRAFNRIAVWIRPDYAGVPTVPLQVVLHNDGAVKVPDRYNREGTHIITLAGSGWQQVLWEIEPLARDHITRIEVGYFVNKMLAAPDDRVAFEIGPIELQRVEPDVHTGWTVAPNQMVYSHSGYQPGMSKVAIASALPSTTFDLVRVDNRAFGETVLHAPVTAVTAPQGTFQQLDFSAVNTPGRYVLRSGDAVSEPFTVGDDAWIPSIWKSLNFYYGNRCGMAIPGVHPLDHQDWFATHGDQRVSMAGGWHDAGDLSQGVINTGEGTYALFALAEATSADTLNQKAQSTLALGYATVGDAVRRRGGECATWA